MGVKFAGAQGACDCLLLDGKAGFGQEMIEPVGQTVGGKLGFYGRQLDKSARPRQAERSNRSPICWKVSFS